MKIGIIGLPGAGRRTVFAALTQGGVAAAKAENAIVTVTVPDPRVAVLSGMYSPRKTTFARIEYLSPAGSNGRSADQDGERPVDAMWNEVRACDALIAVVANFNGVAGGPGAAEAVRKLGEEMAFADFAVVDKRRERLAHDKGRGRKVNDEELGLLERSAVLLENNRPVRVDPDLASSVILRGFGLVSMKPLLTLYNNDDDNPAPPADAGPGPLVIRARIESELAGMAAEDAAVFRAEYGIAESALDRIIRRSYGLLGLISFFTVGDDEVKAWTIKAGTPAVDAAEVIHSDIQKGFIRAEAVAYDDLIAAGNMAEAKKAGKLRLEGKTYVVADGDVINFRFNV